MTDKLETEVDDLDQWLKRELRPNHRSIERVWQRVAAGPAVQPAPAPAPAPDEPRATQPGRIWWAAGAAAAVMIAVAGAAVGAAFQPHDRFVASVVPMNGGQAGSATAGGQPGYANFGAPQAAPAADRAASTPAGAPVFYAGPCSQAPNVQLQGRGVTATGYAALTSPANTAALVGINVQSQAADASAAASAVDAKASAVETSLTKLGLPSDHIQRTGFNVYSFPNNQAMAMLSLSVRVDDQANVAKVITTASQAGATSAYSSTQLLPDSGSDSDLRDAISRATSQAKTMATATAAAAGVQLAQLESVVAQPPQVCYGPSGPQRVVAVTVSYSVK